MAYFIEKLAEYLERLRYWLGGYSLLSYEELVQLREQGVIDCPLRAIKGASIDLTLHPIIRKESFGGTMRTVRLYLGESISTEEVDMSKDGPFVMAPDAVILAAANERFNMPADISADYSLKSSMGRNFLNHCLAGWIDAWFEGRITLELKNDTQFHKLALAPNMPIGQVKFMRHRRVPMDKGYRVNGRYNGSEKVEPSRGIA
jgi:deoxycytidine triphosphate deaminase